MRVSATVHKISSLYIINIIHVPLSLVISDVAHPTQQSLAVDLVNREVVLLEKFVKLQAHQLNVNLGYTFFAHDQPLVF
mgnify:CR=1 FL=1